MQIPIYRGANEALIPHNSRADFFHGLNGFCDVDFWLPHYPNDINMMIQQKHAVEIIRDLVMEVCMFEDSNTYSLDVLTIENLMNFVFLSQYIL